MKKTEGVGENENNQRNIWTRATRKINEEATTVSQQLLIISTTHMMTSSKETSVQQPYCASKDHTAVGRRRSTAALTVYHVRNADCDDCSSGCAHSVKYYPPYQTPRTSKNESDSRIIHHAKTRQQSKVENTRPATGFRMQLLGGV